MLERGFTGVFCWFRYYKHAMREEADDADCQSVNQPVSLLWVPITERYRKKWLTCTLETYTIVVVNALNRACIAYKCVRGKSEWSLCFCFPSKVSFITPPVICFTLNYVSHCTSAGGSNVALCIHCPVTLKVRGLIPETASVYVCPTWKAPRPWAWHQSPTIIPLGKKLCVCVCV